MPSKRSLLLKSFIVGCFNAKKSSSLKSDPTIVSKKSTCSRRLSLSDLSNSSSLSLMSDLSNSLCSNLHVFTIKELKEITNNFCKTSVLGEGGFGKVYKGFIDHKLKAGLKPQTVAVKVLDLDGKQGHREWLAEVIFLGQLKHPHLVNLIAYCCEDEHRLLVYEYLERGNLDTKLFKGYLAALPWLTRIKIAIGAAKGLAFLHEEEKPVIYRDVKASNILLDADFNAKLSDFGLAIDGPEDDETHITTRVMGTEGYAAPEYINTGHLTTMSDVYSFGVVLLELLTGRRSLDKNRPSREQDLVEWARPLLKDPHKLERIVDPRLEGQYSTEAARKLAALAHQCLSHHAKCRPTMRTVVKTLEPLMNLTDFPVGHFVYVVPTEGENNESSKQNKKEENVNSRNCEKKCEKEKEKNNESSKQNKKEEIVNSRNCEKKCEEEKEKEKEKKKKEKSRQRQRKSHRNKIKPFRRRAVYSDTTLYKTLGTNLYSSNVRPEANGDGELLG